MFRFYLGLWTSKFLLLIYKIFGNKQDDKPGLLAFRFTDKFLQFIKKPKDVIVVSGTNGKTTTANLIAELLIKSGKKVIYNDWGANTKAGIVRCLLDGVSIFNKVKCDIAVLEVDEITFPETIPYIKPNYILVTNLFRDSMHRNAHPEFVFNKMNEGINKEAVLVLNADDPISSRLGENSNKCIYYGIGRLKTDLDECINIVNDFTICPKCKNKLSYDYVRYHQIGKVRCPSCGFESKKADYNVTRLDYDKATMDVVKDNKKEVYTLLNDSIFNAYNLLSTIVLLKQFGINYAQMKDLLKCQSIVKSRYSKDIVNGIEVDTIACKGICTVATSRVLDYVSTIKGDIEIIIVIDDTFDNKNGSEAIAWIYDSDFEFLNRDNIKKIIVGGVRNRDYRLRLLLAGVPSDKIVTCQDEYDTYKYLDYDNVSKILILHEVYFVTGAYKLKDKIEEKIREGGINK